MKAFRQLLRQPMKTLMGILLVTLAVAVLCVGLGQTIAAYTTEWRLAKTFQTAAFPSAQCTPEADQWTKEFAAKNPRMVSSVSSPGLVSAYIPQLTPDNYTDHVIPPFHNSDHPSTALQGNFPRQYTSAVLLVKLTSANLPQESNSVLEYVDGMIMRRDADAWYSVTDKSGKTTWRQPPAERTVIDENGETVFKQTDLFYYKTGGKIKPYVTTVLEGTVEGIISLEEGYVDSTGYAAQIYLSAPDLQTLKDLDLEKGGTYLVYTTSYRDDWIVRNDFALEIDYPMFDAFDMNKLHFFTAEEKHDPLVSAKYDMGGWEHGIRTESASWIHKVFLDIEDPSLRRNAEYTADDSGEPLWIMPALLKHMGSIVYMPIPGGETPVYSVTEKLSDQYTYTDVDGAVHTVPVEDFHARYARPTIARLKGTPEDFLADPDNVLWRQAMDDININNHSFPVVGVDKLQYIPDFLRGLAKIVEGRDFTKDELRSGAPVCLLSRELAEKNGLKVGDTISPQLFSGDVSLPGQTPFIPTNPVPMLYHGGTTELESARDYTIVGIYSRDHPWTESGDNVYSFTPNTIFAPKSALPDWQKEDYRGLFRTVVLHGRGYRGFMEATAVAGFDGQFYYYDNGYVSVAESLENYRVIAGRVFAIGLTVYLILMVLYLLLYPAQQRKTMIAMERLGADRRHRMVQVELSSLGILIPGTVLGAILGALLWNRVVQVLLHTSGSSLAVEMSPWILAAVAAAQLIVMSLLTLTIAAPLSKSRGISDKR